MRPAEFCELVERRLGWEAKPPRWRSIVTEASKVSRRIEENPSLYTWENLRLTVELLAREKLSRSPLGVFAHVERAVELIVEPEDDTEEQIREVMRYESMVGDPHGWTVRFARADGHFRKVLLDQWRESTK